jgi:putative peptidoglycan lipid II flippase
VTFGFSLDNAARRRLPRIVAAALLMGGLLWLATTFVLGDAIHGLTRAVVLLALIAAGIAAYGALLTLLDVTGWRELVNAFSRPGDLRP